MQYLLSVKWVFLFAGYLFKDTLAGNLAKLRGGSPSNLAVRRQHLNPMVATQQPKWSQKSGGQFQVGVGVGKPLPSQLFSLEPKKKVVFVTEEGDFQPFFPNYNSISQEVEKKEEEGRVCLLSPDPRLISGFDFSRAAMSHNQTIY